PVDRPRPPGPRPLPALAPGSSRPHGPRRLDREPRPARTAAALPRRERGAGRPDRPRQRRDRHQADALLRQLGLALPALPWAAVPDPARGRLVAAPPLPPQETSRLRPSEAL